MFFINSLMNISMYTIYGPLAMDLEKAKTVIDKKNYA